MYKVSVKVFSANIFCIPKWRPGTSLLVLHKQLSPYDQMCTSILHAHLDLLLLPIPQLGRSALHVYVGLAYKQSSHDGSYGSVLGPNHFRNSVSHCSLSRYNDMRESFLRDNQLHYLVVTSSIFNSLRYLVLTSYVCRFVITRKRTVGDGISKTNWPQYASIGNRYLLPSWA